MTISSEVRKAGPFNGNGVTTSFPFSFKCFSTSDVLVTFTSTLSVESVLVFVTDYSISLNPDQNSNPGGTVTYSTLNTGEKLTITGNIDYTQVTDIQNAGGFYPEVIENAFDKLTMQVQQVKEEVSRSVKIDVSSITNPSDLLDTIDTNVINAVASAASASASASAALVSENAAEAAAIVIDGFEWKGTWTTLTVYAKNNLVYDSGTAYIALSAHTAGATFAGDYGAGKWAILALKGSPGAGTGDMLAANNLSEVTPAVARANLSAAASGANGDITSLTTVTNITAGAVTAAANDKVFIQDTSASDVLKTVTVQSIANLATAGLGIGQTWQNMLGVGGRAVYVPITNSTGKPIMVCTQQGGAGGACNVTVDGVIILIGYAGTGSNATFSFIVPDGSIYTIGGYSVINWAELR